MARVIEIDGRDLVGWPGFHDCFARTLGFPSYYGRNLDAWVDMMEEALEAGPEGKQIDRTVTLRVSHWQSLQDHGPAQAKALIAAIAAVNERVVDARAVNKRAGEAGETALLALAPC